jgi:hypothetical protein
MKRISHISATLEEPRLLIQIVEQIAKYGEHTGGFSSETVPPEWAAIDISSTEVFVGGRVNLAGEGPGKANINLPFTSSFLFTCIRDAKSSYQLEWGLSLS